MAAILRILKMEKKPGNELEEQPKRKKSAKRFILPFLALVFLLFVTGRLIYLMKTHDELYHQYKFRVTRELVRTVTEAKTLLEEKGDKAFPLLDKMKFDQMGLYLYVYRSSDGMCLYHGENSALIGTRLDKFTDQLGKPLHKLVSREIKNPLNRHGWVHYYWNRPHGLFLEWKSACNLAVSLPDGTECYVGGGLYGIGAELEFARIVVTDADHLLKTRGEGALTELLAPTSPYFFHNTAVFLLRENGKSIIDPVLKKRYERDLLKFKDAVGHYPFKHLLRRLKTGAEAQVVLYAHSPLSMNDRKKIIYARRCTMGGEPVIVGTVIDAPQSAWQR